MNEKRELLSLLSNRRKAERWLIAGIRQIKYEDLEHAIENNVFADDILFNHFSRYTLNPILSPIIRAIFREHWRVVESLVSDVNRLYCILTENRPEFAKLLGNKKGITWLTMCAKRGYTRIYDYTWR